MKKNRKAGFEQNPYTEEDTKQFAAKRIAHNIIESEEAYKQNKFYGNVLIMLGLGNILEKSA